MPGTSAQASYTCIRCLRALRQRYASPIPRPPPIRGFSSKSPLRIPKAKTASEIASEEDSATIEAKILNKSQPSKQSETSAPYEYAPVQGAMSRRLAEATEETLFSGGRAGRKAIEEAGFSEELKARLLERVEAQKFSSENAAAIAEVGLSSAAGRGTRDIAAGQAWTGVEATEDTVLRMLTDAHKPLKPGLRGPSKFGAPNVVDLRIKRAPKRTSGQRLANARDKTSIYASTKDSGISEKEREALRKELKERFMPAARAMPNSIRGLQALANERIEDAIARGQFKNIPRGKAVERDARADNPFIDTTEYLMNKMIQRQDIVPPWIEKQQELVKTANIFRARLRNDWKRHAARSIASRGGSLHDQVKIADRYAESERVYNPRTRSVEQISVPTNLTDDPVMIRITQEAPNSSTSQAPPPVVEITTPNTLENTSIATDTAVSQPSTPLLDQSQPASAKTDRSSTEAETTTPVQPAPLPLPFRDPIWEKAELSYLTLAVADLNNITRSYNLMAPDLAKKPYFNLERELKLCYADVAPQVSLAIRERATRPAKELVEKIGHRSGGVLERFSGETARVYDEKTEKAYGLKEFWMDLWGKEKGL